MLTRVPQKANMKFSATIPLAMLVSTITAQGFGGPQGPYPGTQNYQPQPQGQPQGYGQGGQGGYGQGQGGYTGQNGYQGPPNYGVMQGGQVQQTSPWPNIPGYEVKDWQQCTNQWLNAINIGQSGSSPVCTLWQCLTDTANKYNRGKAIAAASTVLDNLCKFGLGSVLGTVC